MTTTKRVLKGIGRVLVGVLVFNALSPLSVLAQEKGSVNPLAQRELRRVGTLNQKLEQARTEGAQSQAERTAQSFKRAQDLVRSLKADAQARGALPAEPTAQGKNARDTRAVGPNVRIEVQRKAYTLGDDRRAELGARLKEQLQAIREGQASARAEFEQAGKELQANKLPEEILARQAEALGQFEQRSAEFERLSRAWQQTPSEQNLAGLDEFFKRYPAQRAATPFDPKKLPSSTPKPTTREPAMTRTAWFQQLWGDKSVRLAQAGGNLSGISFQVPPEPGQAPSEADLASTEDAQITQVVRDQAAALGNNPVAILRWVHNTLEWVPSWGSLQGAESTLVMRRGNAVDIASATIALLRAAGVPARYVLGTVEVDADRLTNWIGGAESALIAQDLLQQGGVAATAVVSGGRVTKLRMQHAWVSAYANWVPSRGAKQGSSSQHVNPNGPLNAWVELDPSYKQHTFSNPIDINAAVPIDASAIRNAAMTGATIDTTQGFIGSAAEASVLGQIQSYGQRVQAYLDSRPELTLGDLVKRREVISDTGPMLAGVLPHRVLASQALAELPESTRHAVVVKLFASTLDRENDAPALSYRTSLAALNYRRLGVTYEPASEADRQTMASATTSLPAYLINVRPTIQIDGATVAAGSAVRMASEQYWTVSFVDPSGANSGDANFSNHAGDEIVFGVNGNGITPDLVAKRNVEGQPGTAAGNLEQGALMYWLEHDVFDQMAAPATKVMTMRMPSVAQFAAPLTIRYFFGFARSASYQSISGDGRRVLVAAAGANAAATRNFALMDGMQGSAIEGSVLDQLYSRPDETSVSTTQFFAIAMRQGLRLFSITADNIATALPQIATSQSVKDDIVNAVNAGYVAFVPERDVTNRGYTGIGYLLLDPQTGNGAYLIDGGTNGLSMPLCEGGSKAPGGELSVKSLFSAETVTALFVPAAVAADSVAEREAKRIAAEAIAKAAKSSAERVAKRVGPRILLSLLAVPPGVNLAIAVAMAVALSIELLMLVIEIKLILAELEIQTVARTDEDLACRCKKTPDDPLCACKKFPEPHKPPRSTAPKSEWNVYNRRVDFHHTCADNYGNSYPGSDVRIYGKGRLNRTVDLFNNAENLACEVKTSFKNEPYDPYVLGKWLNRVIPQLAEQKEIAVTQCGWKHCVVVNKQWMKNELEKKVGAGTYDIRVVESCSAQPAQPDPNEIPETPLDLE